MTQPPISPGPMQPQPYQQPYGPPVPQVINKPGGLTSTAHVVHIIACFLTCGLWIPGYILFAIFAPKRRTEVVVPVGADPAAVEAAYAQTRMTDDERRDQNGKVLWVVMLVLVFVTTLVVLAVIGSVYGNR